MKQKLIFVAIVTVILPVHVFAMPSNPSLKTMITAYSSPNATIMNWMSDKFDYQVSGPKPLGSAKWFSYMDVWTVATPDQMVELKNFAVKHGFFAEDILVHAKKDYNSTVATPWSYMGKFDVFEGKNGVLRSSDEITFSDLTASAFNQNVNLNQKMYFGYEEPFAEVNFTFSTPGNNVAAFWEYWDGSQWSLLALQNDGTNNFQSNGRVNFNPPADWKKRVINNSRNKYFVRLRFDSAVTYPVASSIKGDGWINKLSDPVKTGSGPQKMLHNNTYSGSGTQYYKVEIDTPATFKWSVNTTSTYTTWTTGVPISEEFTTLSDGVAIKFSTTSGIVGESWVFRGGEWKYVRGWDANDPNIINKGLGELEYNPNPPFGATAKFRYQARISSWGPNHFGYNPADFQTSSIDNKSYRTSAKFFAESMNKYSELGYDGIMGDDIPVGPDSGGIAWSNTDFVDKTSNTWAVEAQNRYADIVDFVHTDFPGFYIGGNTSDKTLGFMGDWVYVEDRGWAWQPSDAECVLVAGCGISYDSLAPENNPKGVFGLLMSRDSATTVGTGTTTPWDRGNRAPMLALAKHYIAMNENTIFEYQSNGGWIYNLTDEVYLKSGQVKHMATDPIPSYKDVERWGKYFPAMSVDIGIPDVNGYNGGKKNLKWIEGPATGDGKADVWRRDFTKAIVLMRTAHYLSSSDDYNNPYTPIELGGTYYPLYADGTTGEGVTSISLRTGEAAVLLKSQTATETTPISFTMNDVIALMSNWLKTGTVSNVNSDTIVNSRDLGIMMSKWSAL